MKEVFIRALTSATGALAAIFIWGNCAFSASGAAASGHEPELPILGLANVGIQVSDLEKSRAFYHNVLGFDEAFDTKASDGSVAVAFFKINDNQFLELSPGLTDEQVVPMTHIALRTDNLKKLRQMLEKRGVKVGSIEKRPQDGNLSCTVSELPGINLGFLEFVQYLPHSPEIQSRGKALGTNRISVRFDHAGMIATNFEEARNFFVEKIGCREDFSRKSDNGQFVLMHLILPGKSGDFVEISNKPRPVQRPAAGMAAHFAMTVQDAKAAYQLAQDRGAAKTTKLRFGMDKRWQFNMFDPDGTRTECMQVESPDGKP